jgi:ParB family chromosome partitioning protein
LALPERNRRGEQLYLMSLIESIARRPPSNRALFEVRSLSERGYKAEEISKKLGLEKSHTYGIVQLLKKGEEVLLQAVDDGRIPLRIYRTPDGKHPC